MIKFDSVAEKIDDVVKPIISQIRPPPRQPMMFASPFGNTPFYSMPYGSTINGDNIPSHPYGHYECPICNKKYISANYLGEHFTISHNDYEQQSNLDVKPNDGFPGHEILEAIGMYDNVSKTNIAQIIESEKECQVCCRKFNNLDYIQETNKDTETYSVFPVLLKCCNEIVCKECIRLYLSVHHDMTCLLCYFNHTVKDKKYITIYENSDTCNKWLWIEWRFRHPL
jgi:hypothetical protein